MANQDYDIRTVGVGNRLIVAVEGAVGDWAAYEGPCKDGAMEVMRTGCKLSMALAASLFPDWAPRLNWRD
jgi:hypothetical protein